ncbi:hypothetical protein A3A71_03065 [Candidatus Berkelbacteria bacterium RIFCSPLOWO2_01_FULL_50_28]|uniref:PpiC domain-containing protein n=1 Tax=Candidatus Berkelbacteria bacterium RIFCSPLOWO2_01_FULL_50_28 TaxID=1797471 RepID=A0A1F5ECR4_9BACT|nr:MAG: hypothetical protein A2807_02630 [Candidatus Berkelbacteria bacterium RIFCSPHIGHO2_01_FULL_50_36]OGD63773.1 MAG: hypothetical protein A3F39_03465 [Candidatus Berkelbacteria bacterium RIFCSPHIGHO2_12_FULL_50_11]OGD65046.1 MAG: hypothetical protein A3A71_03065 [Candidatus Berkelbacteria bacterium RIFCSPLOWO2_01_FULL_50_28]
MDGVTKIRGFLRLLGDFLAYIWRLVASLYNAVWGFLAVRVPIFRALVARHVRNPSTVIIDIAICILTVYFAFGVTGYVLVYPQRAETRFAEALSIVYPLPAARVNSSFIWTHRFLERLRFLNTFTAQAPKDLKIKPPTNRELRTRILEGLVENQVIYLEARKRGVKVTKKELQAAVDKQGKSSEIKAKVRKLYGMSLAQFQQVIAEELLREKVKDAVLSKLRVRHILLLDLTTADEVRSLLKSGKSFKALANKYSQDSNTAKSGGDLGYWRKGELTSQISPGFEKAVFALKVKTISQPVQSQYGFHIIQVTEQIGTNKQTYPEWYAATIKGYKIKKYLRI